MSTEFWQSVYPPQKQSTLSFFNDRFWLEADIKQDDTGEYIYIGVNYSNMNSFYQT